MLCWRDAEQPIGEKEVGGKTLQPPNEGNESSEEEEVVSVGTPPKSSRKRITMHALKKRFVG